MLKNKNIKGAVLMSLASVCFSIAGVLFKIIPWGAFSSNGIRALIAACMFLVYMKLKGRKIVVNKTVVCAAVCMFLTTTFFALSNKNTSAANAIILQFTAPVFIILYLKFFKREKQGKNEMIACTLVFAGLLLFFCDSLTTGNYLGDFYGLISGVTYAGVFLFNTKSDSDAASAVVIGYFTAAIVGLPFAAFETDFSLRTIGLLVFLGVFQLGFGYLFFTSSLAYLPPVPASLISGLEPVLNPLLVAVFYPAEHLSVFAKCGAAVVLVTIVAYNVAKALKESKIDAECSQNT